MSKKKSYPIRLTPHQLYAVWVSADAMMCVPSIPGHEYEALRRICQLCEPHDGTDQPVVLTFTPHQLRLSVKSIELALRYLDGSAQPYGAIFHDHDYASELREAAADLGDLLPAFRSFLLS